MVDAGNQLLPPLQLVLHAKAPEKILGADLNAVAQAHGLNTGIAQHEACKNGHGIGVVQEKGIGADLLHIPGKGLHYRDGPQAPHNTADPQGVGNGLPQAVFLGNLKVNHGTRIVAAHLDGIDHEISSPQGLFPLLLPQIAPQPGTVFVHIGVNGLQNPLAFLQPHRVNVIKRNLTVPQRGSTHDIAQNIPGKNGASGTHKSNFHGDTAFLRDCFSCFWISSA